MKIKWMPFALILAATASAQMTMDAPSPEASFMEEMNVSMKRMDHDMAAAPMAGDIDRDFAAMMIPHHQGAIDMAKGELRYGKAPEMRRLAEKIIADQQSEIDLMSGWLKKHSAAAK